MSRLSLSTLISGPLVLFLGTEGLISHYLWWGPISDNDRFHMLHHSLVAGVPLTAAGGLLLSDWWRPAKLLNQPSLPKSAWLVSGAVLLLVAMVVGIFAGVVSLFALGALALVGIVRLAVL